MTLPYILRHSSFAFTACTVVVFALFTFALCVLVLAYVWVGVWTVG